MRENDRSVIYVRVGGLRVRGSIDDTQLSASMTWLKNIFYCTVDTARKEGLGQGPMGQAQSSKVS